MSAVCQPPGVTGLLLSTSSNPVPVQNLQNYKCICKVRDLCFDLINWNVKERLSETETD